MVPQPQSPTISVLSQGKLQGHLLNLVKVSILETSWRAARGAMTRGEVCSLLGVRQLERAIVAAMSNTQHFLFKDVQGGVGETWSEQALILC